MNVLESASKSQQRRAAAQKQRAENIPVKVCKVRPYHLWDPMSGKVLRSRNYVARVNAYYATLKLLYGASPGTAIYVYNSNNGAVLERYVRTPHSIDFKRKA